MRTWAPAPRRVRGATRFLPASDAQEPAVSSRVAPRIGCRGAVWLSGLAVRSGKGCRSEHGSSGRTADFGSVNRGSNPRGAASRRSSGDVPEWSRERSAKPRTRVRFPSSPPPNLSVETPLRAVWREGRRAVRQPIDSLAGEHPFHSVCRLAVQVGIGESCRWTGRAGASRSADNGGEWNDAPGSFAAWPDAGAASRWRRRPYDNPLLPWSCSGRCRSRPIMPDMRGRVDLIDARR